MSAKSKTMSLHHEQMALPSDTSHELRSSRILVVDDEKDILSVYSDILSAPAKAVPLRSSRSKTSSLSHENAFDLSFDLTVVSTGEDALLAVKKSIADGKPFAMGFFDVLLGTGIDGIETVRRIHEIDKNIYAVLVTAYQDRHVDTIQNVFGKEFQDRWDYLNKPFSKNEILQKARNMVSMWNVRQREKEQRQNVDFLKMRLSEGERMLTVAAVARSVGHEFGNILLQIMGRADLARTMNHEEMRKALDTILVATEHAAHVLERFKNLAKPNETHKKTEIDVSLSVQEALMLIEHDMASKNIEAVVHFENLPPVFGNHSTLVQVFMNLVINAVHAMKQEGCIEFKAKADNKNLEITVRDTGPGIAGESLEKIFEPFFTTKGAGGTGLGLSICKEIVEITHAGKMTVRNHPDGGAEFCIALPLYQKQSREEDSL